MGRLVALLLLAGTLLAAPAAASTPPPANGLVWRADTGGDLLDSFERNDYNEQDGAPDDVASPGGAGRALRVSLDEGDQRSEVLPRVPDQREGTVQYTGYRGVLADDFPVGGDRFQILLQWHQFSDDGSPPLAISIEGGQLILTGGDDRLNEKYATPIGPIRPGAPIDLVIRIAFSRDADTGQVDIWSGGRQVVTAFRPPDGTLYDDGTYMKLGLYRSEDLSGDAAVTVDDVAVGTTRQAVDAAMVEQGAVSVGDTPDAGPTESSDGTRAALGVGVAVVLVAGVATVVVLRRRRAGAS